MGLLSWLMLLLMCEESQSPDTHAPMNLSTVTGLYWGGWYLYMFNYCPPCGEGC